jgi:hypothetical protein
VLIVELVEFVHVGNVGPGHVSVGLVVGLDAAGNKRLGPGGAEHRVVHR